MDGQNLFRQKNRDICTVDGSHPNDLGFADMAEVIGGMLINILRR